MQVKIKFTERSHNTFLWNDCLTIVQCNKAPDITAYYCRIRFLNPNYNALFNALNPNSDKNLQ